VEAVLVSVSLDMAVLARVLGNGMRRV